MVKTAPRISDKSSEYIPTQFATINAGLEYLADAWPTLHRRSLAELKGRFSAAELSLIIDVFNATALTPALAGQQLAISVADGIALDGLDSKWGADAGALNAKIAGLTSFQAAAIEIWANGYWYAGASTGESIEKKYDGLGLSKYLEALL